LLGSDLAGPPRFATTLAMFPTGLRPADATDQGTAAWSYNDHHRAHEQLREELATYERWE
jgi:hypothetical protein